MSKKHRPQQKKTTTPKYKDTVFRRLFGKDPQAIRSLYNGVEDPDLPPTMPITINTLPGVIYQNMLNDLSFMAGDKLIVLIEHQSSFNPNMPFRLAEYALELYKEYTNGRSMYGSSQVKIPYPQFIVLYNGIEPQPDEKILKLSDAFLTPDIPGFTKDPIPPMELIVTMYNVNLGHNAQILAACPELGGYSTFIAKARDCEADIAQGRAISVLTKQERRKAILQAVDWCIQNNVLKMFMQKHRMEVVNMLYDEWNLDTAQKVWKEEGIEQGIQIGQQQGIQIGQQQGIQIGQQQGIQIGQQQASVKYEAQHQADQQRIKELERQLAARQA
jgi:hypothetical protein